MDPLTELLRTVRVEGTVFSRAEMRAPWGLSTRGGTNAIFHVVLQGQGVVVVDGRVVPWSRGDLVVLPHGTAHVMADSEQRRAVPIATAPRAKVAGLPCVQFGGEGPLTQLLCGTFRVDPEARELLARALPPVLVMRAQARTSAVLEATLALVAEEVADRRPGADAVIERLAEVLFVQVLRGAQAELQQGWLAAFGDERLVRAMDALQREPARDWSAADLAKIAGMSRSTFFGRFSEVVGEPPNAWLLRWRMHLARRALRSSRVPLAELAAKVGYGSEAAFSRAFKRFVGEPPSAWRERARSGPAA